ncbi:hypothetical protein [Salinilacihabitans rarus]|uniref:hypothetical protein n=1 Tax=Salinilacihabitans rarus TaxID=2961596 RepID=UPI0020C906A9|nr:hypothetical protein [Salinilacihabitans rarus]
MIAADRFSSSDVHGLQSVTMHEAGHVLGVGWADDTAIEVAGIGVVPKGMEVYSGDINGNNFEPDETPEYANGPNPRWSIMRAGTANDLGTGPTPRLAFSLEELSTIDFEDVPSRDR